MRAEEWSEGGASEERGADSSKGPEGARGERSKDRVLSPERAERRGARVRPLGSFPWGLGFDARLYLRERLKRIAPPGLQAVARYREAASRPGARDLALGAVAGLLALLVAVRRRSGDLAVCIEYPSELRGSFSVRCHRRKSLARATARRLRGVGPRAASTRSEQHMVAREAHFRGLRARRYWITIEGELRDADSGELQKEPFEVQSVVVRARQTVRAEFDLRPTLCSLTVKVLWGKQPAKEAAVALFGQPHTLRYARGGSARLEVPLGGLVVVAGSGDRVAEREIEIENVRPLSMEIDLGGLDVLFRGCPHAVMPYLRGELAEASRALAREGQTALALRIEARQHELGGDGDRAVSLYREAGDWQSAARLLSQIPQGDPRFASACATLAECFEREGRPELAVSKIEQAIGAVEEGPKRAELHWRLAELHERCEDLPRALEALERVRTSDPAYPGVQTRVEALRKRISRSSTAPAEGRPDGLGSSGSRYELLREIGAGGMGVVFRARDRRLGREIALKRLPENLKYHPTAVELFLREARAAAALNHPNIVTIFDADEEDGTFFITMELLVGDSLSALLRRHPRLCARDVVLLGRQVAAGLEYAHERRIVHRDIKPANLFFTRDKVLKIMDFGLAKMIEEVRRQVTALGGTPYYMAPEQSAGEPLGSPADMYALGVTLFELLTGRVPFSEGDVSEAHRSAAPPDPRGLVEGISDDLAGLVLELLAKRPEDRPPAAEAGLRFDELAHRM
jgi:tRNA A-37 threonylcarbamoyl transferase component Bud32